ncbi:hypothetical protein L345_05761, partial [Ophiophagus hannah]
MSELLSSHRVLSCHFFEPELALKKPQLSVSVLWGWLLEECSECHPLLKPHPGQGPSQALVSAKRHFSCSPCREGEDLPRRSSEDDRKGTSAAEKSQTGPSGRSCLAILSRSTMGSWLRFQCHCQHERR